MDNPDLTTPFQDIRRMIVSIPGPDESSQQAVRDKDSTFAKTKGSFGRLEWLAEWVSAWQHHYPPTINRPLVCVFAASHGIAKHALFDDKEPSSTTMLDAYSEGNSAITQICGTFDFGFRVFDLASEIPTKDISEEPALDEKSCVATMAYGMEAVAGDIDILALGATGTGSSLSAAAIFSALYGGSAEKWVPRETHCNDALFQQRVQLVEKALLLHKDHFTDPLEILSRLGGREIAALAGAILAARLQKIPVILDGYACTAAASVLYAIHPATLDHCIAGQLSAVGAHRDALERIQKIPLIALGLQLEDGCGAALAMSLVKAAVTVHNDMQGSS